MLAVTSNYGLQVILKKENILIYDCPNDQKANIVIQK